MVTILVSIPESFKMSVPDTVFVFIALCGFLKLKGN